MPFTPPGMPKTDFFGDPYVPVAAGREARSMAFGAWVENIVAKLDSSATVEYTLQPNFAGDIIFATVTVPSIGAATMDLTYYHYDSLTRVKANPVNAVEASLKWYSAHPVE